MSFNTSAVIVWDVSAGFFPQNERMEYVPPRIKPLDKIVLLQKDLIKTILTYKIINVWSNREVQINAHHWLIIILSERNMDML